MDFHMEVSAPLPISEMYLDNFVGGGGRYTGKSGQLYFLTNYIHRTN